MKKVILALVLAALGGGVWAQWVPLSKGDSGAVFYVDRITVRTDGNLRRFWMLIDLEKATGSGDLSYLSFNELDCKEARNRSLEGASFRGQMASGEVSGRSDRPSEWRYVAPGTSTATIMEFVCGR
jgi:hypothetical protein